MQAAVITRQYVDYCSLCGRPLTNRMRDSDLCTRCQRNMNKEAYSRMCRRDIKQKEEVRGWAN